MTREDNEKIENFVRSFMKLVLTPNEYDKWIEERYNEQLFGADVCNFPVSDSESKLRNGLRVIEGGKA